MQGGAIRAQRWNESHEDSGRQHRGEIPDLHGAWGPDGEVEAEMGLHERLSQCQGPVEGAQTHSHPEGGEEGGFEDQECHDVARPGPDRRQGFFRMGVEVALKAKDVPPVVQPEEEGRDLGDGDLGEGEDPLEAGLVPWRRGRAVLPVPSPGGSLRCLPG